MKIKVTQTRIRTIRQGDPRFMIQDGPVMCARAGFEISAECPAEYRQILMTSITCGYIKPVAHMYGKELTMDAMRE